MVSIFLVWKTCRFKMHINFMEIKAILFDLGNTLVHYYQRGESPAVLRECLHSAANVAGSTTEPDDDGLFERATRLNRDPGDYKVRTLANRLRDLFPACAANPELLERVSRAFMTPIFARARRDSSAIACLDELRRRGIPTAIVSNTPWGSPANLWREELERHALSERVHTAVFCVDVGWRKPHEAPFVRALELLGVPADQAAFVGDEPVWDVEGARHAGLQPVLLTDRPGSVEADCTALTSLAGVLDLV